MGQKFGMLNWKRNLITDGKALMEWRKKNGNNFLFSPDLQKQIKDMLANNVSPTIIARTLNIGRSSIYRYK